MVRTLPLGIGCWHHCHMDTDSNDAPDTPTTQEDTPTTTEDPAGRTDPPFTADEYETVTGYIDFHRQTLAWKIRGLGIDQLRATIPSSAMTLGGMLAHLSFVEDFWISLCVGSEMPEPWASTDWDADQDADWHLAGASDAEALWKLWEDSVERSRGIVDGLVAAHGPDAAMAGLHEDRGSGEQVTLRWILVHLVEEYARHVGHADLLREAIDGLTGE